jgi:autoinducer 2-degrading protein
MFTVVVHLAAQPARLAEFLAGIRANARASLRDEPGCLRFDVHQQVDDPTRFVLHELYVDEDAFYATHRTTPHYAAWQQVAARCVVPGTHVNTFCRPVGPEEEGTP